MNVLNRSFVVAALLFGVSFTIHSSAAPTPATLGLFASGIYGLGLLRRKQHESVR